MDRKLPENPEILRLIELGDLSRSLLDAEACRLRERLDVPARVRNSLKQHPSSWLFGSMATGLAASFLLRRKPAAEKRKRGFTATMLGLTLTAAKPLARVWLTDQLKHWVSGTAPAPSVRSVRYPSSNPHSL